MKNRNNSFTRIRTNTLLILLLATLGNLYSQKHDANKEINYIYVATNDQHENSIVAFKHSNNKIEEIGEFQTKGKGTGNIEIFDWGYDTTHPLKDGIDPLISAYSVFKTDDNKFLLAVNPGDGSLTSFKIKKNGKLSFASKTKTGDIHPLSIAVHKNMVYVASAGSTSPPTPPFTGNLSGFFIDNQGKLTPIKNSIRNLNARPSCTMFTQDGKFLAVNELVTGLTKVYQVNNKTGRLSESPISKVQSPNNGTNGRWLAIPVGFDIVSFKDHHVLYAAEARFLNNKGMLREEANVVPQSPKYSWQTGSTSAYKIDKNGMISVLSPDVLTGTHSEGGEIANCWIEVSPDKKHLWAANALSSSYSSYDINDSGALKLDKRIAFKVKDESLFFGDLIHSKDGKYLYQLIGNKGAIYVFKILSNGNLKPILMHDEPLLPKTGSFGIIAN
ncbi:6-phosphogluconolactonase, cycloisomerase 2 family [Tenacibaculum sp. MAR_2009_124]|uniref:beta-propeller fold lactonase family protein n=1 Tax=Tenacibaculum sp. MAR_2009_124 TaxID=1250059 RepID=UPI000896DD79|nr:beta-propeller fold lactonase family protein [Tenacibaculum sp. MAR_2009_124]SED15755.1 6-phosphogluconolactonase, cycloisomerase 2 family [Tenacibaculum sp. MAR_2009_124]